MFFPWTNLVLLRKNLSYQKYGVVETSPNQLIRTSSCSHNSQVDCGHTQNVRPQPRVFTAGNYRSSQNTNNYNNEVLNEFSRITTYPQMFFPRRETCPESAEDFQQRRQLHKNIHCRGSCSLEGNLNGHLGPHIGTVLLAHGWDRADIHGEALNGQYH